MENKNVVVATPKTGFRRALAQTGVIVLTTAIGSANAAIDVSDITDVVTDGVTAAAVIGLAFLAFKAGIAVFKNLRGAA